MTEIRLVPMTRHHLRRTYEWLRDPALRQAIDSREPLASWEEHLRLWEGRFTDATRRDRAICAGGEHVGNCGLKSVDCARGNAHLWIYLGAGRGRGVGKAALGALLAEAFHELGLQRVDLRVRRDNAAAIALYEGAGFRRGEDETMHMLNYALLRGDRV